MDRLYIIIPAYNEEENIEKVLLEWYPVVLRHNCENTSRLIVINDGSRDGTGQILQDFSLSHPLMEAITRKNTGHGGTILYGYHYALSCGADYIFQTDSDGQTSADEFESFWIQKENYDMVIGRRNHREDGFMRKVVTKVLKFVIRISFHAEIPDANTPFRLIRCSALQKYLSLVPENYFLSNVLISVIFTKMDCRILFLPITFRCRQGGKNSINIKKILKTGRDALHDFRILNRKIESYPRKS